MFAMVLVVALGTAPGPLLFDAGGGRWLVMGRDGAQQRVVTEVAGKHTLDAAVSPDGKGWGFVADEKLWVWREGWTAAREVPRAGDVLMSPAFSPDGKWLYFVQNDFASMQAKAPMRFAQVWRVPAEGGTPQKLTRSSGCHMYPAPMPGGGALVTHATCRGGRGVDLLTAAGREEMLRGTEAEHGEAALDPTGTQVAFVRDGEGTELHVLTLATKQAVLRARVPWRTQRLRPAWAADGKTLWIQNEEGVWRAAEDGAVAPHLKFSALPQGDAK